MADDRGGTTIQEKPADAVKTGTGVPATDGIKSPFRIAAEGLRDHPGWPAYLEARKAMKDRQENEDLEDIKFE